eukprot:6213358-Pleurochrysis_carterae.AAC.6
MLTLLSHSQVVEQPSKNTVKQFGFVMIRKWEIKGSAGVKVGGFIGKLRIRVIARHNDDKLRALSAHDEVEH